MWFGRNLTNNHRIKLFDAAPITRFYALKTGSEKWAHKAPETIGEFRGNKITNKIVKPKTVPQRNQEMLKK